MAPCHCGEHLAAGSRSLRGCLQILPMPTSESPMPPTPEFRSAAIQDSLPGMKLGVVVATATGLALLIALLVYNDAAAVFATVVETELGL
jgi:hypothetical protein